MNLDLINLSLIAAGLAFVLLLGWLILRRKSAEPQARFKKVSKAYMADFLIQDGEGGEIHVEHALLCPRGIVIVNIKDIDGNIFGSDGMDDWTVITGKSRFTFPNPQPGLYDRMAAVGHLLPDIPVEGWVAFTERGQFSKGLPKHVANLETLLKELTDEAKSAEKALDAYWPAWEKLREQAVVAQVAKLIEE